MKEGTVGEVENALDQSECLIRLLPSTPLVAGVPLRLNPTYRLGLCAWFLAGDGLAKDVLNDVLVRFDNQAGRGRTSAGNGIRTPRTSLMNEFSKDTSTARKAIQDGSGIRLPHFHSQRVTIAGVSHLTDVDLVLRHAQAAEDASAKGLHHETVSNARRGRRIWEGSLPAVTTLPVGGSIRTLIDSWPSLVRTPGEPGQRFAHLKRLENLPVHLALIEVRALIALDQHDDARDVLLAVPGHGVTGDLRRRVLEAKRILHVIDERPGAPLLVTITIDESTLVRLHPASELPLDRAIAATINESSTGTEIRDHARAVIEQVLQARASLSAPDRVRPVRMAVSCSGMCATTRDELTRGYSDAVALSRLPCSLLLGNDADMLLFGLASPGGVVASSGGGSVVTAIRFGPSGRPRRLRLGGESHFASDWGSKYVIARKAIRATFDREELRRAQRSRLQTELGAHTSHDDATKMRFSDEAVLELLKCITAEFPHTTTPAIKRELATRRVPLQRIYNIADRIIALADRTRRPNPFAIHLIERAADEFSRHLIEAIRWHGDPASRVLFFGDLLLNEGRYRARVLDNLAGAGAPHYLVDSRREVEDLHGQLIEMIETTRRWTTPLISELNIVRLEIKPIARPAPTRTPTR